MRRFQCALLATIALIGFASVASSADLPVKGPVYKAPVAAPAFSWTGFYVGANVGYGWGGTDWSAFDTFSNSWFPVASFSTDGFIGGLQGGYRYQTGQWVFGAEGSFDWANIKGSSPCLDGETCSSKTTWIATLTGQVGWAMERTLLYVKGGAAWAHNDHDISGSQFVFAVLDAPLLSNFNAAGSETRLGWILGAGAAYAFDRNWSGFLEYNYMDFGNTRVDLTCNPAFACVNGVIPLDVDQHIQVIKAGINYRFN